MAFRIHEIEVPEDDPFTNDVLHRKEIVEFLAKVLEYLRSLPGAEKLFADRMGSVIEAEMLAAEPDRQKRDANLRELESISQDEARSDTERKKAREIVELISYTS